MVRHLGPTRTGRRVLGRPAARRRAWRGGLQGSEYTWAIAFCIPYIAVFFAFVVFPVAYGLWLGHKPALYAELFSDPIYQQTVVNTLLYLAIGVNVKMFCALLLSGFFMRRGWWVKGLLMIYVLPWAVPALPTFISIHWMLNGQWGLINNLLWDLFHIDGPGWLDTSRWLALGSVIVSYIWKIHAVLDGHSARRPDGDPAGALRGGRGRRRHRAAPVFPCLVPAAGQPLYRLHPAVDDLHPRRLQHGLFRVGRRAGADRRTCWRRSASATPSTSPSRISASRR